MSERPVPTSPLVRSLSQGSVNRAGASLVAFHPMCVTTTGFEARIFVGSNGRRVRGENPSTPLGVEPLEVLVQRLGRHELDEVLADVRSS
jgi:hypothetical protein